MLTVQQAKYELKKEIQSYLLKDADKKYIMQEGNKLPFYLVGTPGIGKTQIVKQVAEELEIGLVSVSAAHYIRNTVHGLPVMDESYNQEGIYIPYTKDMMLEILADVQEKYEGGEKEGILLLDEFASMAESLVAPMLAFLETKNIGDYTLPEGWTIVLCVSVNSPVYKRTDIGLDASIIDRVRVLNVEFHADEFILYGIKKNFHSSILNYLKMHKNHTYICEAEKRVLVTARDWEILSHCIEIYEQMEQEVTKDLIMKCMKSAEVAHSFYSYFIAFEKSISKRLLSNICEGEDRAITMDIVKRMNEIIQWKVLDELSFEIIRLSKEHQPECNRYFNLRNAYKYLFKHQQEFPDLWNLRKIVFMRGIREQSFSDEMEKEIFGNIKPDDEEWRNYLIIYRRLMWNHVDNMIENGIVSEETLKQGENDTILKIMEDFILDEKKILRNRLSKINDRITNIILFLNQLGTDDECFVASFIEKIWQEPNVLDLLFICGNHAFGDAVMDISKRLGRGEEEQ